MKLRNKKTGEIDEVSILQSKDRIKGVCEHEDGVQVVFSYTLAELNEEWEDYEEPHETYRLTACGKAIEFSSEGLTNKQKRECVNIGNYFETKEEAEKAVEKLKAWKQLKDKGFKVDLWDYDGGNYQERIKTGRILFRVEDYEENDEDLDLLFGGEE